MSMLLKQWIAGMSSGTNWSSYWATRTPSALLLTVLSDTSIKLDWTANGVEDYDGYSIERSADGVTYAEIDTVAVGTETYTDTVTTNTNYYYKIRAYKGTNYSDYEDGGRLKIIPQFLRLNSGESLESFASTDGWTANNGTLAADTDNYKIGNQSIKLTTNAGAPGFIQKTVSWDLSVNNPSSYWVYIYSDISTIKDIKILLSSNPFTSFFTHGVTLSQSWQTGWNYIDLSKFVMSNTGSESWDNTISTIRIRVQATTGNQAILSFSDMRMNETFKPVAAFTFDDGLISAYSVAYPYLAANNGRATNSVISDSIGTASHMSLAQIKTMYDHGWTINNHSKTHTNYTTLTQEQIETEISTCAGVINGNACGDGLHISYPFGGIDADTISAMVAQSAKTGRATTLANAIYRLSYWDLFYIYCCQTLGNTTSLATAKTDIDNAIARQGIAVFLGHDLIETPTSTYNWAISDFEDLVDYCVANDVEMLSIDDLYRLRSSAIGV